MSLVGARRSETQQSFVQLLPILLELLLGAFLLYKKMVQHGIEPGASPFVCAAYCTTEPICAIERKMAFFGA